MIFAIGIDIGTHAVGYAAIRYSGTETVPELVACGCCKARRDKQPLGMRLAEVRADLSHVLKDMLDSIDTDDILVVGVERPFVHPLRGAHGAIEVSAGFGVALEVAHSALHQRLPVVYELANNTVKMKVVGDGRATKNEVRAAVMRIMAIERWPADPLDVSDALAIALTAAFRADERPRTSGANP